MRSKLETKIYEAIGQYDGFYTKPPLDHRTLYLPGNQVVSLNNDGGETWLGTRDKWHCFYKNSEFRKICFWFLWTWAWVDWFGLRSFIWYKLLTRQVNRHPFQKGHQP